MMDKTKMTQHKWIIGGAFVALVVFFLTYLLFFNVARMVVVQAVRGPAVEAIYATGTVEPVQVARIGANVSGRIEQMFVHEGDTVVGGEVLAVLDNREASAIVRELEAKLDYAKADVERSRRLFLSGNTSAALRDRSESNFHSAEAALDAARVRLQEHFLRAPISGDVMRSEQQLDVGDLVTAGRVLFVVGDPGNLWVEAEVDEEDIPRVKVGQRALIRADAFEGQALEGTVREITPFGDPVARTYRVHIQLPDDTPLLSGMTTEINVVVRQEDNALLVPTRAVKASMLWVVSDDDIAHHLEIKVGAEGANLTEIREGLGADQWIFLDPPDDLKEGAKVHVERQDRPLP